MFAHQLTWIRALRRNDRGAVAMIVAIFLGSGALLGLAALTVDVGSMYAQRRGVQNGADAAALAIAQSCIITPSTCSTSGAMAQTTLVGLNGQATLGDATLSPAYPKGVCGRNLPSASDLPACADPSPAFTDCPAAPSDMLLDPYIEVHAQTQVAGGHILPPIVAKALGFGGANVQACARVSLHPPMAAPLTTLPIAMSYCDWKQAVGYVDAAHPGTFQPPPQGAWPGYGAANPWPATESNVITAQDGTTTCPTWNGHSAPGGFAWLSVSSGCQANVVAGWVSGVPGNNYQCDLTPYYGKVAALPIYDCLAGAPVNPITSASDCVGAHGSATYYHIVGYAPFYLSGWNMSSSTHGSIRPPNQPPTCSGSQRCLTGWFTHALFDTLPPAPNTDTDPGFGGYVVLPAG